MLSEKEICFYAGFTGCSRARGYVRNGRVKLMHASQRGCVGTVRGLDAYSVTVVLEGEYLVAGCGCPGMAGHPVRLHLPSCRNADNMEGEGNEPAVCPHVAAAMLVWGTAGALPSNDLVLRPLPTQKKALVHTEVLLYWHEVLEEVRVIPRIVFKEQGGRMIERLHPLAMEASFQERTGLRNVKHEAEAESEAESESESETESETESQTEAETEAETETACEAVRMFFSQWPGWTADENGFLSLPGMDGALNMMTEVVPLFPPEWKVLLDQKLERMRPKRVVVQTSLRMGNDERNNLLSFNVQFHCDQLNLTDSQLQAFIRGQQVWLVEGERYVQVVNLDALRSMLRLLAAGGTDEEDAAGNSPEERLSLRNAQLASELLAWAGEQEAGSVRMEGQLRALVQDGETTGYEFSLPELPEPLVHTLRSWQRTGVGWLSWMAEKGFGCVLADDMGLGKTLQALAFFQGRDRKRPSLLLCPKSLLFNWLAEARRFVPELRVLLVHGSVDERQRLIRTGLEMDLLVTTYPLFLSDWEHYRNFKFDTFLLDEAQLIRNPETRLSRHVRKINASFRVAMTGTPLENSALDLWSIFDFVMPGFLGNQADFRTRCLEGSSAWPFLVRRVRPFLLRRTKREVLPDLPAKTEVDIPVELTQNQLALYEHTRTHIRAGVEQARNEHGSGAAWIALLAGLTRLRQICDHPGLVQEAWRQVHGVSGKMEAFDTLIGQCLDGGHKVLVFSQFASMLVLLENHLNRKRISCLRLDGQTRDRQPLIDRFNKEPGMSVFLISLKAGGFGLNLTAADTVILFDPWWNPMVEEQAADRAHRFGQTRPVTIYRLITRETIETRMQRLKAEKRAVFDAIVNGAAGDREGVFREELETLLGP